MNRQTKVFVKRETNGEVLAVMPEEAYNDTMCLAYSSYEGHVPCQLEYAIELEDATYTETVTAMRELERLGYDVRLILPEEIRARLARALMCNKLTNRKG